MEEAAGLAGGSGEDCARAGGVAVRRVGMRGKLEVCFLVDSRGVVLHFLGVV